MVGLARLRAIARVLRARAPVLAADKAHPEHPEGIEAHLGRDGVDLLDRVNCVVKSPGVPGMASWTAARDRIPVFGELELAWRLPPNRFIAVTGTNGKTTTAEMLGAVLRAAGWPVAVAGNVGTPLSSLVDEDWSAGGRRLRGVELPGRGCARVRPETALLLNLGEDYLDRHGKVVACIEESAAPVRVPAVRAHRGRAPRGRPARLGDA